MNGKHTLDPCAGDGACLVPPAEFVRLRYFFGQSLGVVDLADEQSYLVGKQRFHNLRLHGIGVLCGLRAERHVFPQGAPTPTPTTLLRVRRGAALDGCGREIVVGWDQCIDVAAWLAKHPGARPAGAEGPLRLWVAVCYRECPSDPAPAPRDPCGCDAGGCDYARVREGFELKLLTDDEAALLAPAPVPDPFGFAAEESLGQPLDAALGRAVRASIALDCPPPPEEACLLLANFTVTVDPNSGLVTDLGEPDNAIAERRALLSTAALQRALLGSLAALGDGGLVGTGPRLGKVDFVGGTGDSGTLTIEVVTGPIPLARDPFAAPVQLAATVSRFRNDGTWEAAPAFTTSFVPGSPSPARLELAWAAGSGLVDGGRYRVVLTGDAASPPVDTLMRPLAPLTWARHFRLVLDSGGRLVLAATLQP